MFADVWGFRDGDGDDDHDGDGDEDEDCEDDDDAEDYDDSRLHIMIAMNKIKMELMKLMRTVRMMIFLKTTMMTARTRRFKGRWR